MKELISLLVMSLALLLMVVTGAVAAKSAAVPKFGMNHDFVWTPDEEIPALIQAMKDAHVQVARLGIRWTVVEPERGKWNWTKVDSVVRQLREARIDILVTLMSVPAWASEVKPEEVKGFWDSFAPKHMEDWSEYAKRTTARYKKDVRYWEIWNEENGSDFYRPMPDEKTYVLLLKTANLAIKAEDPKATVVLGGLAMNGVIANPWSPDKVENFLQRIYDAGGKAYFDVVNIHPYVLPTKDQGPAYGAKLTRDTVSVMRKNGDGKKPLWITEDGCATGGAVTEAMQAEHLTNTFHEFAKIPEVKAVYWFTLRDYESAICGGEDSMGLMAHDGHRKPAFDAYKKLAESGSFSVSARDR